MRRLFENSSINGMQMPNRFVRSATWAGLADDNGECTPQLIEVMTHLAEGGVGLIITGHAYVHVQGRHQPRQLGVDRDALMPGLQEMTKAVHKNGGRIALQLGYGGAYLSRSRVVNFTNSAFKHIRDCFSLAAKRAQRAGFDAVQILAAHGFLLSQMLCPRYNDREDNYGGSVENRARLLIEVVEAMRHSVTPDYPVMAKLNCQDFVANGLTLSDAVQVGKMLENAGTDALEISGGLLNVARLLDNKIESENDEAFFKNQAVSFKNNLQVPLILVGGIRSYGVAETLVGEGVTDYVAMCRPFICEHDLINRWRAGDHRKAACISCNNCVEEAKAGRGIACVPIERETPSFFPQASEYIPASSPHPLNSVYQVSIGLAEIDGVFSQMVKVQMVINGRVDEGQAPTYPAETDDYHRVSQAISKLIAQYRTDP